MARDDLRDVRRIFTKSGLPPVKDISIYVENGVFYCPKDMGKPVSEKQLCTGTYFVVSGYLVFALFRPKQCLGDTSIFHELLHASFAQNGIYKDGDFTHSDVAWETTLYEMEDSYRARYCKKSKGYVEFEEVE